MTRLVLDNLGSVVAVVSTAGTVVARYTYDPYGNAVSVDESGLGQPDIVRYTGGVLDQATGLIKLGQRYYDPAIGAFTQQDAPPGRRLTARPPVRPGQRQIRASGQAHQLREIVRSARFSGNSGEIGATAACFAASYGRA